MVSPALSLGGRWAAVGGGIGLVGGITLALSSRRRQQRRHGGVDGWDAASSDTPHLDAHDSLNAVILDLAQHRHVAPREFRTIRETLETVLELAAKASTATPETVRHAWPGMTRHAAHRGSEALRLMHAKMERAGSVGLDAFAEAAAEIQTAFDSCLHNVAMDVSCAS